MIQDEFALKAVFFPVKSVYWPIVWQIIIISTSQASKDCKVPKYCNIYCTGK